MSCWCPCLPVLAILLQPSRQRRAAAALWHSPLHFHALHLFWRAVLLQPLSDEFWSLRCIDLQTFPLQYSFSWWQSMKHMITQQPKLFKEIECVWLVPNFCFLSGLSVEQVIVMLVSNSFECQGDTNSSSTTRVLPHSSLISSSSRSFPVHFCAL